jgi:hypothetical protein
VNTVFESFQNQAAGAIRIYPTMAGRTGLTSMFPSTASRQFLRSAGKSRAISHQWFCKPPVFFTRQFRAQLKSSFPTCAHALDPVSVKVRPKIAASPAVFVVGQHWYFA